jgi:branched-chain amino acid transport system permease protein
MLVLLQQVINGVSIGAIYSLLAVGYALVYSVYNFTNWAFDGFMAFGAFMGFAAIGSLAMPFWLAMIFSMILTAILSILSEKLAYAPLRVRQAPRLFMMISAMGVNLAVVNTLNKTFSGVMRRFPIPDEWITTYDFGEISIGRMDILAAIIAFVCLALLWWFLFRTRWGLGVRVSSIDIDTAALMGVSNNKVAFIIFFATGVLSSVAGVFFGIKYAVYPLMGGAVTIKAMIASIVGGLGSLPGAVLGSLLLGVLETMVSGYVSSAYRDVFAFALLIILLLFFPNGLMGREKGEKL